MTLPTIADARELDQDALSQAILDTKKQLFTLRLRMATRQPVQPHEFRHLKHRLAQLLTVEKEQQLTKEEEHGS